MNKILSLISLGALAVIYFSFSEKPPQFQPEEQKTTPQNKQRHLTNAFSKAKKHAVK